MGSCRVWTLLARVLLCAFVWVPAQARAQHAPARSDILRGRVVSDSGMAVGGADVVVTVAPDRSERATRTDSAGRFELRIAGGSGDYLVHVTGLGWKPWRKRVTREGADSVLTVDVTLNAQAVALAAMEVDAEREQPSRGNGGAIPREPGSREEAVWGVNGSVPPASEGNLSAMAATVPGVLAVPGGISVLGLPPGQNNAALGGMSFSGGELPRDARMWTRVSSSTFDPSRGGYGGAQIWVELAPGYELSNRRAHLTIDAPPLQYGDAVSKRLGQRFTAFQGSFGADGELIRDRYYYNVGAQLSRRREDATTLLNAGEDVLRPAGVARDSVARLLQLLTAAGLPVGTGVSADGSRLTTTGSFVARLDHTPDAVRSWGITAYGSATSADAALAPLALPTRGGRDRSVQGMLQGEYSVYFYKNFLNLTRSALSIASQRVRPALRLPDGRVLVGSTFAGMSREDALATLAFGGNSALESDVRSWTWESVDELQWYNANSRHRFKIYGQSRLDGYERSGTADQLGSYSYASLADLASNRPSSYSRVLSAPRSSGGEWSGVLAAGDRYRHDKLSLLYGARLEANRFTAVPESSPGVLAALGARTDVAPSGLHVSPRFGFAYSLTGHDDGQISLTRVSTRIAGPRGVVRGGIGEFRALMPPALLSDAMVGTGLAGATRHLLCVGAAVPVPDWTALAGGAPTPASCADGSSAFVDAAPAVRLFDPSYDAARSWRANLGWSGTALGLGVTVDGVYSLNLDQPGGVDLNFRGAPQFVLPDEGRPVYVSASAIVAGTGLLSALEARRSPTFGRVLSQRSDLRGWGRQVTITVAPGRRGLSNRRSFAFGAYTLAASGAQYRGFDGAAFGDPALRETAPGDYDVRHQIQVQAGYAWKPWLTGTLFGTLSSGRPFTPLVGADVNGDGVGGDRAFVFDPATAADASLAAGMRSLLATSPRNVRSCLVRQLGRASARNSCRGPWTADLHAQIAFDSYRGAVRSRRVSGTLNLANPLGGLDQLLHGGGRLHGWGTPAYPDPVLYDVRGFDSAAQRFRYAVNPRFGDTRPSATTFRAPFRLTLDISIDLNKPIPQQQLERSMAPGHRMDARALQKMHARNVLDIYRSILEESDSLLLTPEQTRALKEGQAGYRTRVDSLWADLAGYLVALPDHYDGAAALKRQEDTVDRAWDLTWRQGPTIKGILSPLQLRMVPRLVDVLLNAKECPKIRMVFTGG